MKVFGWNYAFYGLMAIILVVLGTFTTPAQAQVKAAGKPAGKAAPCPPGKLRDHQGICRHVPSKPPPKAHPHSG